jgi:ATP-dependent Lon protease
VAVKLGSLIQQATLVNAGLLASQRQARSEIRDIEDGEIGITYQGLLGKYLSGVTSVKIADPYIRLEYQVRNLEELLTGIPLGRNCTVELVTMYESQSQYGLSEESISRQRLDGLQQRLARRNINVTYSFDPALHDRWVETDKWQIILGRGLDFYYPPKPGQPGKTRGTKKFRVIYLPK